MEAFLKNFKGLNSKATEESDDCPNGTAIKSVSMKPWVEKYRPQTIDQIVYQNEVISMLRNFLTTSATCATACDLPHLLFYGPPGTGKTSTIVALAKQMFPNMYHNRVLELNASDERGIAVIREKVKGFAQQCVSVSNKSSHAIKIVILDECDSMTRDAQSALRRTMEKESKTTRFCLICNYVSRIIEPLVSRCSVFRFKPLNNELLTNKLRQISDSESVNISDESIRELVSISDGDLRRAITLLQSSALFNDNEEVTVEDIRDVAGHVPQHYLNQFINLCQTKCYESLPKFVSDLISDGHSGTQFLLLLHDWVIETDQLLLSDSQKSIISEQIAVTDKRLHDGADEYLQMLDMGSVVLKTIASIND